VLVGIWDIGWVDCSTKMGGEPSPPMFAGYSLPSIGLCSQLSRRNTCVSCPVRPNVWGYRWNFLDIEQEPTSYFENYQLRPDIIATHPKTSQRYALDVTVTSPLQDKYLRRGSGENGYAAKLAENY